MPWNPSRKSTSPRARQQSSAPATRRRPTATSLAAWRAPTPRSLLARPRRPSGTTSASETCRRAAKLALDVQRLAHECQGHALARARPQGSSNKRTLTAHRALTWTCPF
eukprot:4026244-Pleurochrysis_carterae.AAC.2